MVNKCSSHTPRASVEFVWWVITKAILMSSPTTKHYVFVGQKSCTIEMLTSTTLVQTWLILKVWKHLFQIHFNMGGPGPTGVRIRPRSLQCDALETAIEIPLYMH